MWSRLSLQWTQPMCTENAMFLFGGRSLISRLCIVLKCSGLLQQQVLHNVSGKCFFRGRDLFFFEYKLFVQKTRNFRALVRLSYPDCTWLRSAVARCSGEYFMRCHVIYFRARNLIHHEYKLIVPKTRISRDLVGLSYPDFVWW